MVMCGHLMTNDLNLPSFIHFPHTHDTHDTLSVILQPECGQDKLSHGVLRATIHCVKQKL